MQGDALERLRELPDESVHCCVTSPPYWGLRDYGVAGQMGLERTPEEYVAKMVKVFREVRRLLRSDGTLWLNIGDTYANDGETGGKQAYLDDSNRKRVGREKRFTGLKAKDLSGMPWRLAFALQADGWWLRCDIIWHKSNPMPESVTDRPTKSHEYIFLLAKSQRYYYDAVAIRDPASPALVKQVEEGYNGKATKDYLGMGVQDASATKARIINGCRKRIDKQCGHSRRHAGFNEKWDKLSPAEQALLGRNKRDVWTVPAANFAEAHFATYPADLIKPCILAGCPAGGVVLDPFAGSGTTGQVALELGRRAVLIELNPEYVKLIEQRCAVTPGLML